MMASLIKRCFLICALVGFAASADARPMLTPYQALPTSAARHVTPMVLNGEHYLAVPQLGLDDVTQPAKMNSGNADADVIIFKWQDAQFKLYQSIPGHGNEGSAFFKIGNNAFLATSSINSGPKPPYNFHTYSMLYQWDGQRFYPVQQFYAYASKQWTAFQIGDRSFLALANGVVPLGDAAKSNAEINTSSTVYEWNGQQFIPFQTFPTKWAYGFYYFTIGEQVFLALADHASASMIYRFDGKQFVEFQSLPKTGGRAFQHLRLNGDDYLAYANILNDSELLKWNGKRFESYQRLTGKGARSFATFQLGGRQYLFRVNHIVGDREAPKTQLSSPLYEWDGKQFIVVQEVVTNGGADASVFQIDNQQYLAVANSINSALRYRTDSMIYKINNEAKQ